METRTGHASGKVQIWFHFTSGISNGSVDVGFPQLFPLDCLGN